MSYLLIYIIGYLLIVTAFTVITVLQDKGYEDVLPAVAMSWLWPIWVALFLGGLALVIVASIIVLPGFIIGTVIKHLRSRN